MEKSSYKISIQPIGTFFFGGERNFYDDARDRVNYLVHSLLIPQQTTVLGMLRYALRGSLLKCEAEDLKLEELIGATGFSGEDKAMGVIERISPVFLENKDGLYYEAGIDYQVSPENRQGYLEYKQIAGKAVLAETTEYIPYLPEYELKLDHKHFLVNEMDTGDRVAFDQIFLSCEQAGNFKNHEDFENDKEGFYKEIRYRLSKGFQFCFFLETSQKLCPASFLAFMGGEQSEFKITVTSGSAFEWEKEVKDKSGRVVLQSDAFLTPEILATCSFALLESTNFRHIKTNVQMKNYALISYNNNDQIPSKSCNIKLAGRGSVLYCDDLKSFSRRMSESVYRRIGYNYFQIKNEYEELY